jgi:hypothetical protein
MNAIIVIIAMSVRTVMIVSIVMIVLIVRIDTNSHFSFMELPQSCAILVVHQ